MAFSKIARAVIVQPKIGTEDWRDVRRDSSVLFESFGNRKASVVLGQYDPSRFLLSHATIVASVDVEKVDAPLGKQMLDGVEIFRKFPDYRITKETEEFANENCDAFERKLLLSTFKTFVGADSFVEHMQIPSLSKGKIIDAVARDIGKSVYIDILVANDRKHTPLIQAIESGELNTLSMGCNVTYTICTICGNVAEDEAQLCPHIKNFKGSYFRSENGDEKKAIELCGHYTEPTTCKFIEASWVGNPAFKGAVLRNIVTAPSSKGMSQKIQKAFSTSRIVSDPSFWGKTASFRPKTATPTDNSFSEMVDELYQAVRDKAMERLKADLEGVAAQATSSEEIKGDDNETVIRQASSNPIWRKVARKVALTWPNRSEAKRVLTGLMLASHYKDLRPLKAHGFSNEDLLKVAYFIDKHARKETVAGLSRVYAAIRKVGGTKKYATPKEYLTACAKVMGRNLSDTEMKTMISRGKILSLR